MYQGRQMLYQLSNKNSDPASFPNRKITIKDNKRLLKPVDDIWSTCIYYFKTYFKMQILSSPASK